MMKVTLLVKNLKVKNLLSVVWAKFESRIFSKYSKIVKHEKLKTLSEKHPSEQRDKEISVISHSKLKSKVTVNQCGSERLCSFSFCLFFLSVHFLDSFLAICNGQAANYLTTTAPQAFRIILLKMLPLTLLKSAENHPMLIELKNGDTYNGRLVSCNIFMNVCLKDVICTSKVFALLRARKKFCNYRFQWTRIHINPNDIS